MSSPVQDHVSSLRTTCSVVNIVPESPPPNDTNALVQHQQHQNEPQYAIVMVGGGNHHNTMSQQQQQEHASTIREAQPSWLQQKQQELAIPSPLQQTSSSTTTRRVLSMMQRSPPNVNHIFRPRLSSSSKKSKNRDTNRRNHNINDNDKMNHLEEEHRQDVNNNRHEQQHDSTLDASAWEPIPWSDILEEDEDDAAPLLLLPRFQGVVQTNHDYAYDNDNNNTTTVSNYPRDNSDDPAWLQPSSLPLPPSPLVRRRYSAAAAAATTASPPPPPPHDSSRRRRSTTKRKSNDETKVPRKQQRLDNIATDTTTTAVVQPPPSLSWPSADQAALLHQFWHYCAKYRPHLLSTLTRAVKEVQKQQQQQQQQDKHGKKQFDHTSVPLSLESAVMEELTSAWGAPLFDEVRTLVLQMVQKEKELGLDASASRRLARTRRQGDNGNKSDFPCAPCEETRGEPTRYTDNVDVASRNKQVELAIAYGFSLAKSYGNNGRELPPNFWREAAQTLQNMSPQDQERMWNMDTVSSLP